MVSSVLVGYGMGSVGSPFWMVYIMNRNNIVLCALLTAGAVLSASCSSDGPGTVRGASRTSSEESDAAVTDMSGDEDLSDSSIATAVSVAVSGSGNSSEVYQAYYDALMNIRGNHTLPDGRELDYLSEAGIVEDDQFAVYDIDGDSRDEMILLWTTASASDTLMYVYEYNAEADAWTMEICCSPSVTVYDDGMILAEDLYDQGYAVTITPYTVYTYNENTDSYIAAGAVDCWDRAATDGMDGEVFPEEYDTDDSGVVYMIDYAGYIGYSGGYCYSQSEYDGFVASLIGDKEELDIDYLNLSDANIDQATSGRC